MLYENESFQLNPEKMPKHVAIIMDGNGRWATKRGLPRKAGHKAGAEALERIIYAAKGLGTSDGVCFFNGKLETLRRRGGGDYGSSAVLSEKLFQEIREG